MGVGRSHASTGFEFARQHEPDLNETQRQVMDLLVRGKTNAEIGEILGLSLDGAKWNVSEILSKLGLESRDEAARYWHWRASRGSRLWAAVSGSAMKLGLGVSAIAAVGLFGAFVLFRDDDSHPLAGRILARDGSVLAESDASGTRHFIPGVEFGAVVTGLDAQYTRQLPGTNIQTTLDPGLQREAYQLAAQALAGAEGSSEGAVVVMDARNGAVRALVSFPGFEASSAGAGGPNAAIAQRVPGAVFEPISAIAGLSEGVITPASTWNVTSTVTEVRGSNGAIFPLFDWRVHGWLNLSSALAWSSSTYFFMATCGLPGYDAPGLGNGDPSAADARLEQYASELGIGQRTGVDLPGEDAGIFPNPAWKRQAYSAPGHKPEDAEWYYADTCYAAVGAGDVRLTPLQVARFTAAIANGGKLVTPFFASAFVDARSDDGSPAHLQGPAPLSLRPDVLEAVRSGMRESAVSGAASYWLQQRNAAGMTGPATAFSGDPKRPRWELDWFTGYAPFDDPRYVITVYLSPRAVDTSATQIAGALFDYLATHPMD